MIFLVYVQKLHNAGWRKWSIKFLNYLGEYKILPLFLPTQKSPKTHEHHHGWKANNNETQQSNKTKTNQKQNKKNLLLWVEVMAVAPTLPIVTWAG